MGVKILGVPSDAHSSYLRGAAQAPPVIRRSLFSEAGNPYTESGIDLRDAEAFADAGDVVIEDNDGDLERIETAVAGLLRSGNRVVSIGGDHSITYPIVLAHARTFNQLAIVHFDAHPDLYPIFQGDRYSHASPFARILEDVPAVTLVQIGIRSGSPPQTRMSERYGVRAIGPGQLEQARAMLPSGNVYVSLDMDALDPAFAPGVSHREPGGLSVRDVLELIKAIPGTLVGADVVEYNPAQDFGNLTAQAAAKFVRELAGRMIEESQRGPRARSASM